MASQTGIDLVTSKPPSTTSTRLCYMDSMSEFLRDRSDIVFVVEGAELPCHITVLAEHSRVFSGMAELSGNHYSHSAPVNHHQI